VIAVLVTYSWKPEGQVFPIREGRNLIGRSDECDVKIPEDAMLSTVNSHITFRQSFTMGDMVSMGGTYLNGEVVEEQFRPLKNLSTIRAGSTQLLFVIVDPKLLDVA
jgi:predicted component of type VI protein secretion system